MDRLTIKAPSGLIHLKHDKETTINATIKKLSDYEDFEKQGKLIKLPCAVGDTIWYWDEDCDPLEEAPFKGRIDRYEIYPRQVCMIITPINEIHSWYLDEQTFEIEDFGRTIFLTEEEAKVALQEMNKE